MMRGVVYLFVLIALICLTSAKEVQYEGDVVVLSDDNFDEWMEEQDVALVEFYAPWCGHCKTLAPHYAEAATRLKGRVALAKVDCTVETELKTRFDVNGFPTLKLFRMSTPTEYKGPRDSADAIYGYLDKMTRPAISKLATEDDVDNFIKTEAAIIYLGKPQGDLYRVFEKYASSQREAYKFAQTDNKDVINRVGREDAIVIFQSKRYTMSNLETAYHIATATSESLLNKWVQSNILPFVGEFTNENSNAYRTVGKPLVRVYADIDWKNAKGTNSLLNRIRKAAADFKDKFSFTVATKSKNMQDITNFGMPQEALIPFSITTLEGGKYPSYEEFSSTSFKQHLEDYLAAKLEPYLKSEVAPSSQEPGKPVVVVASTFDEIVKDKTKDVFLEVYAPWCGYCKKLAPEWDQLVAEAAKISDNVVIAKMDGTVNDTPPSLGVRGFPSIFFFPADKKDSPLRYERSERTAEEFVKYIKENGSTLKNSAKEEL